MWAKSFRFDYQKNIDVSGNTELSISNTSGTIEIVGVAVDSISVNAAKNVRASDQEEAEVVAEHIEIAVKRQKNRVSVQTRYHKMRGKADSFWDKLLGTGSDSFGSVDYSITVPLECRINIESIAGNISVSNTAGYLAIIGNSGDIDLENTKGGIGIESLSGDIAIAEAEGDIDISSGSTDIKLSSITGAIDIRSTSGDKEATYLSGPLTISQASGAIDLKYLNGDLRIKSSSGKINIEQESGAVDIISYSGDANVKTELYTERDLYIETASGNISLSVPEMSSGTVKIETVSGDINAELPMSVRTFSHRKMEGRFGSGGPRISLVTTSGSITIRGY
jgi:DUF4097 and DUF4098 domain-containing protein YvlB